MSEQTEQKVNNWTLVLPLGALTLLGTLLLSVYSEASVGLKLAEQHGESILLLREEVRLMRLELKEQTRLRYTSIDAQRDLEYIKRDIAELRDAVEDISRERK